MATKAIQNASLSPQRPQPRTFALEVPTLPVPAVTSSSAPARLTGGARSAAASSGGGANVPAAEARRFVSAAAEALPTANTAELRRSTTAGADTFVAGEFAGLFTTANEQVRGTRTSCPRARARPRHSPRSLRRSDSSTLTTHSIRVRQATRKRGFARAIVSALAQGEHEAAQQLAPGSAAKRARPASRPSLKGGGSGGGTATGCPMETSPTSSPTNGGRGGGFGSGGFRACSGGGGGVGGGGVGGGGIGGGGVGGGLLLPRAPKVAVKVQVKLLCPVATAPLPAAPIAAALGTPSNTSSSKPVALHPPFDPAPAPFISAKAARCLVLDNDETTGAYQLGSLLFSMFVNLCATPPPVDYFVERYLKKGGARPGLAQLIQTAAELKASGRIEHIVVWTAASNRNGWVTFLSQCLERLAGVVPGTIDRVLTCEHSTKRHRTGRVIKDLRVLTTDTSGIVMVDDKPSFVQHGRVVQVNEYTQHVPIEALVEGMPCSDANKEVARKALVQDQLVNPPSGEDQSDDTEMYQVADMLRQLF
mmetsp:Transcript_15755/g.28332  ORF Transcript_15755/g.28332 Transcript_15755/m.28332 type:complete len:535 (+) Transcript_15755:426-2030(+)